MCRSENWLHVTNISRWKHQLGMLVEATIDSLHFNALSIGFKSCERL